MTDIEVEEFLEHYGVPGMKWGVRKKVRGAEGRAQKAERLADRRPTRGNVRTAQRKRIEADRRNKSSRKERKAEQVKKAAEFRESVIKDIGSRSPSELYVVNNRGTKIIMTGEEFVKNANFGMVFSSIDSTGQKINDGR